MMFRGCWELNSKTILMISTTRWSGSTRWSFCGHDDHHQHHRHHQQHRWWPLLGGGWRGGWRGGRTKLARRSGSLGEWSSRSGSLGKWSRCSLVTVEGRWPCWDQGTIGPICWRQKSKQWDAQGLRRWCWPDAGGRARPAFPCKLLLLKAVCFKPC